MNLIEKVTSLVAVSAESSFQERFFGLFVLYAKPPKDSSELDASFDTSARLVTSKVNAMSKVNAPPSRAPAGITSLAELGQYYSLLPLEKSHRNSFSRGITIGRTNNNDIALPDGTVSKFHAWIERPTSPNNEHRIFDAQSHYGTFVNNVEVTPEGAALRAGAVLRFGGASVTVMAGVGLYRWVKERRYQLLT